MGSINTHTILLELIHRMGFHDIRQKGKGSLEAHGPGLFDNVGKVWGNARDQNSIRLCRNDLCYIRPEVLGPRGMVVLSYDCSIRDMNLYLLLEGIGGRMTEQKVHSEKIKSSVRLLSHKKSQR